MTERRLCYCRSCRAESEEYGIGFCEVCYDPHFDTAFLPMDLVRHQESGQEFVVNSAHYFDTEGGTPRAMFSVCGILAPGEKPRLYYQDEFARIHRHVYRPYKGIRRCDCGAVFTTMADTMLPRDEVTRH